MDSSDSLKIDEHLARLLAAYDQSIEGGDAGPATVSVPVSPAPVSSEPVSSEAAPSDPTASLGPSLRGGLPNEGEGEELLPDSRPGAHIRQPFLDYTPPPQSGGTHRIGRFELRRQLGKGGCGIVFLAYDPKLQREVALKIPRPEMMLNPDAKRRLRLEALAAAEFDHPNLVPVYDFGEVGPLCYIATAFCPGQTLAEWLDRQAFPVPVRQAARLLATVAEAVQHAHDRGVLHRDLKPNNVILQELRLEENDEPPPGSSQLRGEYYTPRLVDFGLAKLAERGGPSETGTRQVLGTPKYMAPEQAMARREDIGPPADVYALGVILYELLAGRAPYDGASDVEVLRQAVEGKPTPPREIRPDIPRDLEAICVKAMARRTDRRYRTAIDLADDLRRFLDGRPTVARPLAWPGRAMRWLRRNDQIVAIAVLMVIVVFVTAIASWGWYLSGQLRKSRDTALNEQATRNRAAQERDYSRQMRDAYLAWRGGNTGEAASALDSAKHAASALMESPDFTHDYLSRLIQSPQSMIVCPAGPVTGLAVSPDGTRLASGHADGTLAVWDLAGGTQLAAVKAHSADVTHVAFALSGKLIFTAGKDQHAGPEALGWSLAADGQLGPASPPHRAVGVGVTCLAVSPDGQALFAGGHDGRLFKIHLADPKQDRTAAAPPAALPVAALAVSPSGQTLVTAATDGTVRRWEADLTPAPQRAEFKYARRVSALAAVNDELPAVGFATGGAVLVPARGPASDFPTSEGVHWIAVAPDGGVALNTAPGVVRIGRWSHLATGDLGTVRAGAFSPDGRRFFTAGEDGIIRVWPLNDLGDRAVMAAGRVAAASVSSGGADIVVLDDQHLRRYDGTGGWKSAPVGPQPYRAVRLLDNGTLRVVILDGNTVIVRDLAGDSATEPFRHRLADGRRATAAALTPDGSYMAIGDDAGRVRVWSTADGKLLGEMGTESPLPVSHVALSDDGHYVATHLPAGVGLWRVGTAEPLAKLVTDDRAAFRFLPGGDRIATGGRDGVVRVWNLAGREESTFFGHVGRISGLGVSRDGRTLVSGGASGEVKFWDLRTGAELFALRRHSTPVTVIEFSSNNRVLVTGGEGQLAVWDARKP